MTSRKPGKRNKAATEAGDEGDLFRRLMGDARPLKSDTAPPHHRHVKPRAKFARRDRSEVPRDSLEFDARDADCGDGENLRFQHPSVSRTTMRKLARGAFSIQAEIDLHGLTGSEAGPELQRFIGECVDQNLSCVRVVHGKGYRSGPSGPVLKPLVNGWLRRLQPVLAFVTARPADGGSGAVYVLLRRER